MRDEGFQKITVTKIPPHELDGVIRFRLTEWPGYLLSCEPGLYHSLEELFSTFHPPLKYEIRQKIVFDMDEKDSTTLSLQDALDLMS